MGYQWLVIIIVFGSLFYFLLRLLVRPSNASKEKIKEELNKRAFELVEILDPGSLNTGPFPAVEIQLSFVYTRVSGVSGESVKYRIVKYKNKNGLLKESWVKIETIAFQISEITWLPDLDKQ